MKKTDFKYYKSSQIDKAITEYVRGYRNQDILRMALIENATYKEIADKYYLSEVAVIKIVRLNGTVVLQGIEKV